MVSPDSQAQRARCQAETPLIVLFKFAEPALLRSDYWKRLELLVLSLADWLIMRAENFQVAGGKLKKGVVIFSTNGRLDA